MRVVTYNVWHGLSPGDWLWFKELEPRTRRQRREQLQLELLGSLDADVICLQEVNPLSERRRKFVEQLKMNSLAAWDQAGAKVRSVGLPFNLESGLLILASKKHELTWERCLQLSGPPSFKMGLWLRLQVVEERFALIGTLKIDGASYRIVNLHLHHGPEWNSALSGELHKLAQEGVLSASVKTELERRLVAGDDRRKMELQTLLTVLEEDRSNYVGDILCGDFNFSPEHPLWTWMEEQGFKDLSRGCEPTFDSLTNVANHMFLREFQLPVETEDLSFEPSARRKILSVLREHDRTPRKIDYIWWRSSREEGDASKVTCCLIGLPDEQGLAPSDHYGVCVEWQRKTQ